MLRLSVVLLLALSCTACGVLVAPLEKSLLYRPRPVNAERMSALAAAPHTEEVRLSMPDGVTLHGFLRRAPAAAPGERYPVVIVYGGALRETSWMLTWGEKPEAWGWLMVNYRGYGLSEGQPSETVLIEDAKRIFDWLAARADVDRDNIVLLGRSLGSHIAVSLAAARPARAVILATPFDSLAAIGERRYPLLPLRTLLNGRYEPVSVAPEVRVPALFVLAEEDDVTPVENGMALAKAWGGPKRIATLPATGHRLVEWREAYWRVIAEFLGTLAPAARLSLAP